MKRRSGSVAGLGGRPPMPTRPISGGSVGGGEVVASGERVVASGQ